MRFLTPAEQRLLDAARPPERSILRQLFELLDARLVVDASSVVPGGLRELGSAVNDPAKRASTFDHVYAWGNNERRAELKGRRCRIVTWGAKNTILVEFKDGTKVTTSRHAVRLVSEGAQAIPRPNASARRPDAVTPSETSSQDTLFDPPPVRRAA